MRVAITAAIVFTCWSSAAFAQFPPPGVYRCTANGAPFGTLSLFAAGDYQFSVAKDGSYAEKAGDPGNGRGQVTSSSTSVIAHSGPLATIYHWKGSFRTDAHRQRTTFRFSGSDGKTVICGR